jgi:acyl carrier protein
VRARVSRVIAKQFYVAPEHITEAATLAEDLRATSHDHIEW